MKLLKLSVIVCMVLLVYKLKFLEIRLHANRNNSGSFLTQHMWIFDDCLLGDDGLLAVHGAFHM
jgi:hypothetical protein